MTRATTGHGSACCWNILEKCLSHFLGWSEGGNVEVRVWVYLCMPGTLEESWRRVTSLTEGKKEGGTGGDKSGHSGDCLGERRGSGRVFLKEGTACAKAQRQMRMSDKCFLSFSEYICYLSWMQILIVHLVPGRNLNCWVAHQLPGNINAPGSQTRLWVTRYRGLNFQALDAAFWGNSWIFPKPLSLLMVTYLFTMHGSSTITAQ